MALEPSDIEAFGHALATSRRAGQTAHQIGLKRIASLDDAEAVQAAAIRHFGGTQVGYSLAGTSALCARLLSSERPVVGPLLSEAMMEDGECLHLPRGVIGVGASFTFVLGRSFPFSDDEPLTGTNAADACVSCYLTLQILGRRVTNEVPMNAWTSTADFGLDVMHVRGPRVADWRMQDIAQSSVTLHLDGHQVATGRGCDVLGAPISAVAWLARTLAAVGRSLEPDDRVTVGSCTGLVQPLPGQTVRACFAGLGSLTLDLD